MPLDTPLAVEALKRRIAEPIGGVDAGTRHPATRRRVAGPERVGRAIIRLEVDHGSMHRRGPAQRCVVDPVGSLAQCIFPPPPAVAASPGRRVILRP